MRENEKSLNLELLGVAARGDAIVQQVRWVVNQSGSVALDKVSNPGHGTATSVTCHRCHTERLSNECRSL